MCSNLLTRRSDSLRSWGMSALGGKRTLRLLATKVSVANHKQPDDVYESCAQDDLKKRHVPLMIGPAHSALHVQAIAHDGAEGEKRRRDPAKDCKGAARSDELTTHDRLVI